MRRERSGHLEKRPRKSVPDTRGIQAGPEHMAEKSTARPAPVFSPTPELLRNDDDIVALKGDIGGAAMLDCKDIDVDFNLGAIGDGP